MSIFSPEVRARMTELETKHGVRFHVRRLTNHTTPEFDCMIRDGLNQVVAHASGDDRDAAVTNAADQIDYAAIGKSPAEMLAELKTLRTQIGDSVKKAETRKPASPKRD